MTILLKNALLLDANHDHAPMDLLVDGQKIQAIGKNLPQADRELDLTGYTVLPGFIDAHVHVAVFDDGFHEDAVRAWARNGVTTVRELGMLSVLSQSDFAQWLAKNGRNPETAQVIAVGKYIDVAGGYGAGPMPGHPVGNLITTPDEAADAVSEAHRLGFPGIKIGIHDGQMDTVPHLSPEMARAICERAKSHGMWVAAHIGNCAGARFMLDAGVTELAHTPSDPMPEEMLRDMVQRGIAMDTTVGDPDKMMGPPPGPMPGGPMPGGPMPGGAPGGPMPGGPMGDPAKMAEERRAKAAVMRENLYRFHQLGGIIAVGTDLIHSADYGKDASIPVTELRQLRAAGLPMSAILRAATIDAAKVVGTGDREGLLEAGRTANLVAVPGRVDASFSALETVRLVLHRGQIIRSELAD